MKMPVAQVMRASVLLAVVLGLGLLALSRPPGSVSHDAGTAPRRAIDPHRAASVAELDGAIAARDIGRAFEMWRDVREQAWRSQDWQALVTAGDAAMRLEPLTGPRQVMREEARRLYLGALFRARAQRSTEGVHRVADAFARLGDTETAASARRVAERLP